MSKPPKVKFYPSALTISGSDSGGGAGIAADLRTFNAFGVYGCCAVTAVNAQNPSAIHRSDRMDAQSVSAQIDAVRERIPVKFVKTGILYSTEIISAVIEAVKKYNFKVICDPAMISANGSRVLKDEAAALVREELFPLASWIVPNPAEAEYLTGKKITSTGDMLDAATQIQEKYQASVWLTGGFGYTADAIVKDGKRYLLTAPVPEVRPMTALGEKCTLTSALTAMLALEMPWKQAVCGSKSFVFGSLEQCVDIGPGVQAMYPATEDFIQLVKLSPAEK